MEIRSKQALYNRLIEVARQNPILSDGTPDKCHISEESPPICLSPEDLLSEAARDIVYVAGNIKWQLGSLDLLEVYRQLTRMDYNDGKFDGIINNIGSDLSPVTEIQPERYYGYHWTPPKRLRAALKWNPASTMSILLRSDPGLSSARGRTQEEATEYYDSRKNKYVSYPLMYEERDFINKTAQALQDAGFQEISNLVSALLYKARVTILTEQEKQRKKESSERQKSAPEDDVARTMLFKQTFEPLSMERQRQKGGQRIEVSVFFETEYRPEPNPDRLRLPYSPSDRFKSKRLLRGSRSHDNSLRFVDNYLKGLNIDRNIHKTHIPPLLKDTYVYRYLAYKNTSGKELNISPETYYRAVTVHEAIHAEVLERSHDSERSPPNQPMDWEGILEKACSKTPDTTDIESLLNYLSTLQTLERALYDVIILYCEAQKKEEDDCRLAMSLLYLVRDATEYLTDDAAWRMILGPDNIQERLGDVDDAKRIFNPNEDNW